MAIQLQLVYYGTYINQHQNEAFSGHLIPLRHKRGNLHVFVGG